MKGSDDCIFTMRKICHRVAVNERSISICRCDAAFMPAIQFTTTGKNAINAVMTILEAIP